MPSVESVEKAETDLFSSLDVNKITGEMATQAAKDHIHPEKFLIVVVGDRTEIQSDIESLNLGDLYFLDENGNPVD